MNFVTVHGLQCRTDSYSVVCIFAPICVLAFQNTISTIITPPGAVVRGGLVLGLLLMFFSPRDLRAPWADRRETLPRYRKVVVYFLYFPSLPLTSPPYAYN